MHVQQPQESVWRFLLDYMNHTQYGMVSVREKHFPEERKRERERERERMRMKKSKRNIHTYMYVYNIYIQQYC